MAAETVTNWLVVAGAVWASVVGVIVLIFALAFLFKTIHHRKRFKKESEFREYLQLIAAHCNQYMPGLSSVLYALESKLNNRTMNPVHLADEVKHLTINEDLERVVRTSGAALAAMLTVPPEKEGTDVIHAASRDLEIALRTYTGLDSQTMRDRADAELNNSIVAGLR